MNLLVISLSFFISIDAFSKNSHVNDVWSRPDWSADVSLKNSEPRKNIYELPEEDFKKVVRSGKLHALVYPVSVSGIFFSMSPMKNSLRIKAK